MKKEPQYPRHQFKTQGSWKKLEDYPNARAICLQMVISTPIELRLNQSGIAGIVGGYCGSDLFVVEQFFAKTDKKDENKITSLWIGSENAVNGQEIDFSSLDEEVLQACHQSLEEFWEWNSENNWLEAQQLRLYPYNIEGLNPNQGLLETSKDKLLSNILKIAAPHLGLVSPSMFVNQKSKSSKKSKTEINL